MTGGSPSSHNIDQLTYISNFTNRMRSKMRGEGMNGIGLHIFLAFHRFSLTGGVTDLSRIVATFVSLAGHYLYYLNNTNKSLE